ncbi:hypothetical protein I533_15205 [Alteromonas mediterranea MED64]|uniref:hypothetical protein n=1 Tax=Alteromonas mediterranea TaxID=314275 RepID=UPI0003556A59|nr:hypothetical protein [Alteromonas mediterranea]AGP82996.1 hypothetical protein I533_15205 [Alteromonas mediterranea MED64]
MRMFLGLYLIKCILQNMRIFVGVKFLAILIMLPTISYASDEIEWECLVTEFPMYLEARLDIEKNLILFKVKSDEYFVPPKWKATATAEFDTLVVGTISTSMKPEYNIKDVTIKDIELTEEMINISWELLEQGQICDRQNVGGKGSLSNNLDSPAIICGLGAVMLPVAGSNQKHIFRVIDEMSWTPIGKFKLRIESLDDSWEELNEESSDANCI